MCKRGELDEASGWKARRMRQTPATTTTTAINALLCDDETRTVTADGINDLGTRDVTNNSFENHEGSSAYNHAKRARCEEGDEDRAVVEFPSSTRVTNGTSIRQKKFCSSCKHNLDAMTYFLENRKTCTTCLTKHKLYEERRRRQHKANDCHVRRRAKTGNNTVHCARTSVT